MEFNFKELIDDLKNDIFQKFDKIDQKIDKNILDIKNYIKNSADFDFKLLDYTVDRYIIDSVTGEYTDKYLVFRNDRTTIT
jgi:hypothetical protein